MTNLIRYWFGLYEPPHRSEICALIKKLPPINEAGRMTTRAVVRRKPRNVAEWRQQHGTRRTA